MNTDAKSTQDKLLAEIEVFLTVSGMAPTRFGKYAVNDHKLVSDLRGGRQISLGTADKIVSYMRAYDGTAVS